MLNEAIAIAHEVKQPLTAVITNGNYCVRELAEPSPNLSGVRAAIQDIIDAGNRAILVISRIGAVLAKECEERAALDINEILTRALDLLRPELDRSGTSVTLELNGNLPPLLGDPVQLQQAFVNVMMNSIEAMRSIPGQHRAIVVETGRSPEGILIEIRDLGPGVLATRSERIFEPLFTTRTDGLGLGLPISRLIAEAHGGSLSVIPATNGAVFRFILPIPAEVSHR